MPRKKLTESASEVESKVVDTLVDEFEKVKDFVEKEAVVVAEEMKKVEQVVKEEAEVIGKRVAEDLKPVLENAIVDWIETETLKLLEKSFNGIWISIVSYAKHVSLSEAIKLLQKILGISKTGVIDQQTISAWGQASGKRELIDDYNNMRKDILEKDLTSVREESKKAL